MTSSPARSIRPSNARPSRTSLLAAFAAVYIFWGGTFLAIRYAVERRRAEASLLRLREEELAAAESVRLERGLLPSPLLAGSAYAGRDAASAGVRP